MIKIDKTITSIFIVPTLGINRDVLKDNGFINGYIKNELNLYNYENCVYLLFKPTDMFKFGQFCLEVVSNNELYVDDFDLEDGKVVLIFKLNDKYKKDYELVYNGEYSKTSNEFKNAFPKVLKVIVNGLHRDELSLQIRIFKKTNDLRKIWENLTGVTFTEDMEVWPTWNLEKEILNDDVLKKQFEI